MPIFAIIVAIIVAIVVLIIQVLARSLGCMGSAVARLRHPKCSYMIFGDLMGLSRDKIKRLLDDHGCKEIPENRKYATIVWSSQYDNYKFAKRSFEVKCQVKNLLDIATHSIITNKMLLHRTGPPAKHFARTSPLVGSDAFVFPAQGGTFILRPATVGYFGGKGIMRISSRDELESARREYERLGIAEHVIVSEYLSDPYLFDGKKFHLRMYFMVRVIAEDDCEGRELFWEVFGCPKDGPDDNAHTPRGKILTAKKPYEHGHFDDNEIHDSHIKSTDGAYFFPTHAAHIQSPSRTPTVVDNVVACIWAQIRDIGDILASTLQQAKPQVRPYAESKNGFEVFGLDLMVVRREIDGAIVDPCVVLLEVNDRVGFKNPDDPLFDEMQDELLSWIWARGFKPCLDD